MATLVDLMKLWSMVVPFYVKRRECRVVSLVIPAAFLSFWYVRHPRRRFSPSNGTGWSCSLGGVLRKL